MGQLAIEIIPIRNPLNYGVENHYYRYTLVFGGVEKFAIFLSNGTVYNLIPVIGSENWRECATGYHPTTRELPKKDFQFINSILKNFSTWIKGISRYRLMF